MTCLKIEQLKSWLAFKPGAALVRLTYQINAYVKLSYIGILVHLIQYLSYAVSRRNKIFSFIADAIPFIYTWDPASRC